MLHCTNVVVSKCWNKPNVTSRRASTLCQLNIFALRDEVTGVIIVLFVGGKHVTNGEQNKQFSTDFPAHKKVKVSFFVQLL